MKARFLEDLKQLTAEEEEILRSGVPVRSYYIKDASSTLAKYQDIAHPNTMIDILREPRFSPIGEHSHDYLEMIYMYSGSAKHTLNQTEEIHLQTDELLFIKQGTTHEVQALGYDDIAIHIMIVPEFLQYPLSMLPEDTVLRRFIEKAAAGNTEDKEFLQFHLQDMREAKNLLENITLTILRRQRNSRRILQATMGVLLLELSSRTYTITVGSPSSYEKEIVLDALGYIETDYKTASLNAFCEKNKLPPYYVSRLMKQYSPYTFTKYLQRRRMLQAAHLLTETSDSVESIIQAVGYENASHFHRLFKEEFHSTPKKYREKYMENEENTDFFS